MSKYRKIAVTITDPLFLAAALDDLKLNHETAADPRQNTVTLKTHWKRFDGTDQPVAFGIDKETLWKAEAYTMDGIGFAWNGAGYDLICDTSDEHNKVVNQIKQRYAVHAARAAALDAGYLIDEVTDPDGTIRLVCTVY